MPSTTMSRIRPLVSWRGPARTLHLTTIAFFASFVVWFNLAPFAVAIRKQLHLSAAQMTTLALCNLALAVPARVVIGRLVGRVGPRRLYGGLLIASAIPNTAFATAHSYPVLVVSRLALGVVGAGFVVGIKMVSSWFPDTELGTAEGVYGGWGNFGSAAAALTLPSLAALVAGGPGAWRWGVGLSGLLAAVYGVYYLLAVEDAPAGAAPAARGLRTASRGGTAGLLAMQAVAPAVLGLVAWRVYRAHVFGRAGLAVTGLIIAAYFLWQVRDVVRAASPGPVGAASVTVPLAPVVLLSLAYGVTFGAELTMASLLPTFFASTFGLKIAAAGVAGSAFAFTNLVTRPGGGIVSDKASRRSRVVLVALAGTAVCFAALTFLDRSWPLFAGIAAVAVTSVFVQGGNGAIFAMVPLIDKRAAGPIAGLAGSFGNAGGIVFSSVLFFSGNDARMVFGVMGAAALVVAALFATGMSDRASVRVVQGGGVTVDLERVADEASPVAVAATGLRVG